VHDLEASALLEAIRLSTRPPSDTEDDEQQSGDETEEEDEKDEVLGEEPVDEEDLVNNLTDEQLAEWTRLTARDTAAGWELRCPDTGRHIFSPGRHQVGCTLPATVTTPLEYFDQLITADTIDYFLIDMAINNACILHNLRTTARKLTARQFREQLMVGLVGDFTQRKKRGRPEKVRIRADEPHHIPMTLQEQQPCMVCAKKTRKKQGQHKPRTREGCDTCGRACHFRCWKEHLPAESDGDE